MHDPRIDQLARQLVRYSTKVKKGDRVWIDCFDVPNSVAVALIRAVVEAKGLPMVKLHDTIVSRELILHSTEEQYDVLAKNNLDLMNETDCYIAVRGSNNITENSDVPSPTSVPVAVSAVPMATPDGSGTVNRNRFVASPPWSSPLTGGE